MAEPLRCPRLLGQRDRDAKSHHPVEGLRTARGSHLLVADRWRCDDHDHWASYHGPHGADAARRGQSRLATVYRVDVLSTPSSTPRAAVTVCSRMSAGSPEKSKPRWPCSPSRAQPMYTVPGSWPPSESGPPTPVVATATSAPSRSRTPVASCTAPCAEHGSIPSSTPSTSTFVLIWYATTAPDNQVADSSPSPRVLTSAPHVRDSATAIFTSWPSAASAIRATCASLSTPGCYGRHARSARRATSPTRCKAPDHAHLRPRAPGPRRAR